jgi:uncharacterized SAM-binding protein YcdF (DUF218 family)
LKLGRRSRRLLCWGVLGVMLTMLSYIPARIMIAFQAAPTPQAIFVLGGDFERTKAAARLWRSNPTMEIWVSDFPRYLSKQEKILVDGGVPKTRLYLDGRATDTVTNFTTLMLAFLDARLQHLYLVTSDYHMARAKAIAMVVLGSRGIVVTPVSIQSKHKTEPKLKMVRDFVRMMIWLVTGRTGASFNSKLKDTPLSE